MKRTFTLLIFQLVFTPFLLKAQPEIIWQKATGMSARDIAFSPDSTEMAVVAGQEIIIRDTKTALPLRTWNVPLEQLTDAFYSIGWSPDGKFIAAATSYNVYYIDPHSGEILQKYDYSTDIQFSPGGKYILDRNYGRQTFSTQRVFTSKDLVSLDQSFTFDDMLIMDWDSTAVVLHGDSIVLRHFPSGEVIRRFNYYGKSSMTIAVQSEKVAIVFKDSIIIFNSTSGGVLRTIQDNRLLSSSLILFTPDGKRIATSRTTPESELHLWDVETGNLIFSFNGGGAEKRKIYIPNNDLLYFWSPTVFNPYLMSAGSTLLPWDLETGKLYRQPHHGHHARIRNLKFANNDENIISYGEDSTEITWDTQTGEMLSLKKLPKLDTTTGKRYNEISPFGTYRLGFNSQNGFLCLWNNQQNTKLYDLVYIGSGPWYRFSGFTPDEQYSILCTPNNITYSPELHIFDNTSGEKIYSISTAIDGMAFAENNRYFAAFDTTYGGFIVWSGEDMATSIQSFKTDNVSLAFYPNPSQESSTISCSLPADGLLKITLHDMLGREVATVHDAFKSAGSYTFPFKAENLPDGLYFLKILSGGRSLTKSVSIMR